MAMNVLPGQVADGSPTPQLGSDLQEIERRLGSALSRLAAMNDRFQPRPATPTNSASAGIPAHPPHHEARLHRIIETITGISDEIDMLSTKV